MARYDFVCEDEHIVEHKFKMEEKPDELECPVCGKTSKHKIGANGVRFILNGTGWYSTAIPRKSGLEGYVS